MIRPRSLALFLAALCAIAPIAPVSADGPSFAVRAKRIMTGSADAPAVIENGVMVIIDGRITAIGPADAVEIPLDLHVIEFRDETIIPGLIAAHSTLAGLHQGEESISGAYHAADAFDRYGDYRELLRAGITTVHLNPGWHRLVAGRGAIVKLGGRHDGRLLNDGSDLTINLGAAAFNPPDVVEFLIPPSGDQPIAPARVQRPASRMDQFLALSEAVEEMDADDGEFDLHQRGLRAAWEAELPLRFHADDARDIAGAIEFLRERERRGYIVGGNEADDLAALLRERDVPLVYTIDTSLRSAAQNLGDDPDPMVADVNDLAALRGITFALATANNVPLTDLRLTAATALRAGLTEQEVLAALTRVPALILRVNERIGTLETGRDADFVVLTGAPLETTTHVARTYIEGNLVYKRESETNKGGTVLIRGGTLWLGPGEWIENGSVLIEDGTIIAAGRHVPHPPGATVVEIGPDAFITPGLIDAHGHLGLGGDRSSPAPELALSRLVGADDLPSRRVAKNGVTSVVLAPYSYHGNGSQLSAIKTAGDDRDARVIRSTAAVAFTVRGVDPKQIAGRLEPRLEAGKKYLEKWQKYERDLEEWRQKKEAGELDEESAQPKVEEVVVEKPLEDPITGTWRVGVTGGPIPEDVEGTIVLKLNGTTVEGRIVDPIPPVEVKIRGTYAAGHLSGEIEVDTGGMGQPQFEGNLVEPDHLTGTISLQQLSAEFDARRTEKGDVEFSVTRRRRTTGKDGRPLPPPVDESLEPIRLLLEKKIPALVDAETEAEINAIIDLLVDKHELGLVLLNAPEAGDLAERVRTAEAGVVLPTEFIRSRDDLPYHQGDDLSRANIPVAFQSDSEDGARLLPLVGLRAVERGMSAEAALAAFTIDAAAMYRLDDRIGRLAPGLDGDVVIFSGHPFETSSRVLRVFINGSEVE